MEGADSMTVEGLRSGPIADAIRRHRLIATLRRAVPEAGLLAAVADLADAGARVFELTLGAHTTEADLTAVRDSLRSRTDGPFIVGAGMVLTRHELEAARRARVDYAAAPMLDPELVSTAVEEGLPFIPGALTPTEVASAWAAGATFVKLFPAIAVGPSFVHELRRAMPDAQLIPAGGIDATNADRFLDAGAAAVAIGTAVTIADVATLRAITEAATALATRS
jgi:2-dehydro-3-deoxyphosphogluconate aldolase/(4S)-4-hydroxy-2-oxoglutarate aldolase